MSKILTILLTLVLLTAPYIITPLPVKAVSKTIVVPDDYPTISAAIGNATDGDTILVKTGTYEEKTLEINKEISIIGQDANNSIINLHPTYNVSWILSQFYLSYENAITIHANNVTLSNLTINTNGGSIVVNANGTKIAGNMLVAYTETKAELVVNGCYNNITGNTIVSSESFGLNGSFNVIAKNIVESLYMEMSDSNIITNNTIYRGISLASSNLNVISRNKIGSIGLGRSSNNVFFENYLGFSTSIWLTIAVNNTFYHNNFVDTGSILINLSPNYNFWDDGVEGNYWSDYNGTDSNRDGIGDTPYVIDADNIDNYPLMEPYDVENGKVVLPPPEPFPTIYVATAIALVAIITISILLYFKKHKHLPSNRSAEKPLSQT